MSFEYQLRIGKAKSDSLSFIVTKIKTLPSNSDMLVGIKQ